MPFVISTNESMKRAVGWILESSGRWLKICFVWLKQLWFFSTCFLQWQTKRILCTKESLLCTRQWLGALWTDVWVIKSCSTNSMSGGWTFCEAIVSPSHSLMRLSKELNIPQRCLEAVSQKQFTVHYFRGFTGIGCCPVNSSLWQLHCNCCDDLILACSPYTNDLCNCPECDLQACSLRSAM